MLVCGVELKANEAIVCLLLLSKGLFTLPDCRVRRLPLTDIHSRQHLLDFQFAFGKLMADYKVEKVVIRERLMKGKFAGGAVSFKLEAAIQLLPDLDVELMSNSQVKQRLSDNPLPIAFADTGLKAFQENAFITAYASLAESKG